MRILLPDQAEALTLKLVDAVPRKVLEATAGAGGMRETQVRAEVARWLPQTIPAEEVRRRVGEALDWYEARGDVEKGHGGRYQCLPPYLIEVPGSGSYVHCVLCGDPRVESQLGKALQPFGARIQHSNPPITGRTDPDDRVRLSRGWERMLVVPAARFSEVRSTCNSRGVSVFGRRDLERALPRVSDVVAPTEEAPTADAPSSGFWDAYRPASERADRWEASKYWRGGDSRLVRWKPSEGWAGVRDCRHFYHAGDGRVAELDADAASLWQLYLDREAGWPRQTWKDGAKLWVPKMLPPVTLQWLGLLAAEPSIPYGGWYVLKFDTERLQEVSETLERTLGLRCLVGPPEYDRPKGRRRGGWSG